MKSNLNLDEGKGQGKKLQFVHVNSIGIALSFINYFRPIHPIFWLSL